MGLKVAGFNYVVAVVGGTGELGLGLAMRLAKAGIEVVIGSRRRERALVTASRVREAVGVGCRVFGEENSKAVESADVVILSIPFEGVDEILGAIRDSVKNRCIVVSCIVPFSTTPSNGASAAEYVSSFLGDRAGVVSAFHTVSAYSLQRLDQPVGCDTIIMGDDVDAKKKIAELTYLIDGLRPVDGGPLRNSRIVEQVTRLLITINKKYKITHSGIRIAGLDDKIVMEGWFG